MNKGNLLDRLSRSSEERVFYARLFDKYEQAHDRSQPTVTGFFSPQEQAMAEAALHSAGIHSGYCFDGGYRAAERRRLRFAPDWMEDEQLSDEQDIACLYCRFFEGDALSHRDFLGSLMALGIIREKLGDILVGMGEAQILVDEAVLPFLLQEYQSAGRTKLHLSRRPLAEIVPPEIKVQLLHDTVMSLRLDSIVAVGFAMSRTKAAELIHAGKVELNHLPCDKSDKLLSEGDSVSARGFGKFVLAEIGKQSRKGRTIITIKRFI